MTRDSGFELDDARFDAWMDELPPFDAEAFLAAVAAEPKDMAERCPVCRELLVDDECPSEFCEMHPRRVVRGRDRRGWVRK